MGRAAVRKAVATALTTAKITYVGTVYPARPVILEEQDYIQTMNGEAVALSAAGSSAVLVVNIPTDKRQRRADTGRGAVQDTDIHDVAIEIFFASTPSSSLAQDAGVAAQQDYDAIVDSLTVYIRNNPTLGTPTTVWSAGEYAAGVAHTQTEPYTSADGLTVLINGTVRAEVWEWVSGTGV